MKFINSIITIFTLLVLITGCSNPGSSSLDPEVLSYTVTYNGNGYDSGVPVDTDTYEDGDEVTVASAMNRPGYTFSGWNTASDGNATSREPDSTFIIGSENIVLYAQWERILLSGISFGDAAFSAYINSQGFTYVDQITELEYEEQGLSDLSGIENLECLEELYLDDNSISDISLLADLSLLDKLYVSGNSINTLSLYTDSLSGSSSVRKITLKDNPLNMTDAAAALTLANFPNLKKIKINDQLGNASFSDWYSILTVFSGQIEELSLTDVSMTDANYLSLYSNVLEAGKDDLMTLRLENNSLSQSTLDHITSNLSDLQDLDIDDLTITDLSGLVTMTNILSLGVNNCGLTSLAFLSTLRAAGAFYDSEENEYGEIGIENNNLTLTTGSADRNIVDALVAEGIEVDYVEGNTTD